MYEPQPPLTSHHSQHSQHSHPHHVQHAHQMQVSLSAPGGHNQSNGGGGGYAGEEVDMTSPLAYPGPPSYRHTTSNQHPSLPTLPSLHTSFSNPSLPLQHTLRSPLDGDESDDVLKPLAETPSSVGGIALGVPSGQMPGVNMGAIPQGQNSAGGAGKPAGANNFVSKLYQ